MRRLRWPRGQRLWPLLLGASLAVACSGPADPRRDDQASAADQRQVPFHDDGSAPASPVISPTALDKTLAPDAGLPFHDSENLPAGTLLTIRLKNDVSGDNQREGSTFEAAVDKPVVIEGNTLLPLGASVTGRVESARVSAVVRNRGYLRLTLDAVSLEGRDVPIQTSSLFARGSAEVRDSEATQVVRLEKGRRLTFRLTEPVYVASQPAIPAR